MFKTSKEVDSEYKDTATLVTLSALGENEIELRPGGLLLNFFSAIVSPLRYKSVKY